ncbi:MAG TPA: VC0807 family protein [Phenylobacterium sp.]|nr:VC0807 family protein [Phenylobacterium sp.]
MVSPMATKRDMALAWLRANGVKAAAEVAVNFALPFLIYSSFKASLGDVRALMLASAPPTLWSVWEFIRLRKVDALSVLVLAGIVLSLLAFAGGGGVKALQLRENLVAGLVGLIFLGSAAIGKPLIYQLARAATRRQSADKAAFIEALGEDARFRQTMMTATLVWGFGLTAICAGCCALVFSLSIKLYMLVSGPFSYGGMGLLTLWTYWYVRRSALAKVGRAGEP